MKRHAPIMATLVVASLHCGPPASRARGTSGATAVVTSTGPTSGPPTARAGSSAAPANTRCDPSRPAIADFRADDRALVAARSARPSVPTTVFPEGALRFAVPAAWFPSRRFERDEVLYRVMTDRADEVVAIHRGPVPPIRIGSEGTFGIVRGGVIARGSIVSDGQGTHRVEAIAVLPCERVPYVSVWARVRGEEHLDAVIDLIRSIDRGAPEASPLQEVVLDATRDRDAVRALAGSDPLALDLVDRALPNAMHARYPLTVDHPLADQLLGGSFRSPVGAAPAEISVALPVRSGRIAVPAPYRALREPSMARSVAELVGSGCRPEAVRLAVDGVAVRCAEGADLRVIDERDVATMWPESLQSTARVNAAIVAWRQSPDRAGGWPIALCGDGGWTVERFDGVEVARTDRCAFVAGATNGSVARAAFTGSCSELPDQPWTAPFRRAVRFDDIRGTRNGPCTFTLGWNGRSSFALAAGDGGTASGPIASGPVVAVDRRAVHTAVAFVVDLERFVSGRSGERPANVLPSVLASIGANDPAGEAGRALARWLRATAAAGPGLAVLGAQALGSDRVHVRFLGVEVDLTESAQGWVVTAVQRAGAVSSSSSPAPSVISPGSRGSTR